MGERTFSNPGVTLDMRLEIEIPSESLVAMRTALRNRIISHRTTKKNDEGLTNRLAGSFLKSALAIFLAALSASDFAFLSSFPFGSAYPSESLLLSLPSSSESELDNSLKSEFSSSESDFQMNVFGPVGVGLDLGTTAGGSLPDLS